MINAELAFSSPHVALGVRSFTIRDGLSEAFEARVTAGSPAADLDLEAIAGHGAALRLSTGDATQPYAVWSGLVRDIEQVAAEPGGESLYELVIAPQLWRTTQRTNYRIFQELSTPEIALQLLADWDLEVTERFDGRRFPRHEYRVQYGESDFAFLCRVCEEAGIGWFFEQVEARGAEKGDPKKLPNLRLVLADRPTETARRIERHLRWLGTTEERDTQPWVANVRLGRSIRSGRVTVGGWDYRTSQDLRLVAEAHGGQKLEERLEQFDYRPPAFIEAVRHEGGGEVRVSDELGRQAARVALERARTPARRVLFDTNDLILGPGIAFSLDGHPRAELGAHPLLVVGRRIDGEVDGEWNVRCEAVLSTDPWRSPLATPKPRVLGLESAMVVGPAAEEIHTDALGRVRVQFHWDRYGRRDERSSCWMRVSQSWAGSGYGTSMVPRVGHEVLVGFLEGDPDQPLVVGRAYNRGALPPDALPKKRTKSTWRTSSSPGGEGHNEISMDDARGEELVHLRAQRDLERIVRENERAAIGKNLETNIHADERRSIGGSQTIGVTGDCTVSVRGRHQSRADGGAVQQAGETTGMSYEDGKLVLTNGTASIVLDGANLYLDVAGSLRLRAGGMLSLSGGEVAIDGGPDVYLNAGLGSPPEPAQLGPNARRGGRGELDADGRSDRVRGRPGRGPARPGGQREAEFDPSRYLRELAAKAGVHLPPSVHLPPELDEQLAHLGRSGRRVSSRLLGPDAYNTLKDRVGSRLEAEKDRLQKLSTDLHTIFEKQRAHVGDTADALGKRLAVERDNLGKLSAETAAIFRGEHGGLVDSATALGHVFREGAAQVKTLRKDLKDMLDRELRTFQEYRREWQAAYAEVKGYVDGFKKLISDPKDAILDAIIPPEDQKAIKELADQLGYGDEVGDFFGMGDEGGGHGPGGHGPPAHPPHDPPAHPPHDPPAHPPHHPAQHGGHGHHPGMQQSGHGPHDGPHGHSRIQAAKSMGAAKQQGPAGAKATKQMTPQTKKLEGQAPQGLGKGPGAHGLAQGHGAAGQGSGTHALSKNGGLGPKDVTASVSPGDVSVLQSSKDGQMLVVPTSQAKALDAAKVQDALVAAQMDGQPAGQAYAGQLAESGYVVYERPWGDWYGPFVQAGSQAAADAE